MPAGGDWLPQKLVALGAVTSYQARLLSAGRSGPFFYGDYKVIDRIEKGRLAGLFRAVHLISGRTTLLSFLSGPALGDARRWAWVVQQAAVARKVDHPYLTRVYELVDLLAYKFVAFDNLDGASLVDRKPQTRNIARISTLAYEVLAALSALHEHGYAHGDVRPANVWLTGQGAARLIYFPLARDPFSSPALEIGRSDAVGRTLAQCDYAAPELARPGSMPDAQSDLYAVGATLYELLSGHVPYAGGTPREKLLRHAQEPIVPLDGAAAVPAGLARVVERMMAKNARLRYQSAVEAMEALAGFVPAARRATIDEVRSEAAAAAQAGAAWEVAGGASSSDLPSVAMGTGFDHGWSPADSPEAVLFRSEEPEPEPSLFGGPSNQPGSFARARAAQLARRSRVNKLVGFAVIVILAVVGVVLARTDTLQKILTQLDSTQVEVKKPAEPASAPATPDSSPASSLPASDVADDDSGVQLIADDGKTMWASPTSGQPLDFRHLPPGAPCLLAIRPADLLRHPEGGKLLDGLGGAAGTLQATIREMVGLPLDDIQELLVGFYPQEAALPEAVLEVRLLKKVPRAKLHQIWGKPTLPTEENPYFEGDKLAYYFPVPSDEQRFVVGPIETIALVAKGERALLPHAMERVVDQTDNQRHATLIIAPKFLLGDGKSLLVGNLAKLVEPMIAFFGDTTQAASLSFYLDRNLFLELRAYSSAEKKPPALVADYERRLDELPTNIEAYMGTLELRPYGRSVLLRFPRMVAAIQEHTRAMVEDRQAVLRCYLPAEAAHNLVLAADLALLESPVAGTTPPARAASAVTSVADALKQNVSLSFTKDTLEHCVELLGQEIGVEFVISGGDLQLEGITRNQSFGLAEQNKPAHEILKAVLTKANPEGKLVYIIKPRMPGGKEAIFITTRAAAAKRGEKLPAEF